MSPLDDHKGIKGRCSGKKGGWRSWRKGEPARSDRAGSSSTRDPSNLSRASIRRSNAATGQTG